MILTCSNVHDFLELSTAFKLLTADTFWLSYVSITTELYHDKSVLHPEMTPSSHPNIQGQVRFGSAR